MVQRLLSVKALTEQEAHVNRRNQKGYVIASIMLIQTGRPKKRERSKKQEQSRNRSRNRWLAYLSTFLRTEIPPTLFPPSGLEPLFEDVGSDAK